VSLLGGGDLGAAGGLDSGELGSSGLLSGGLGSDGLSGCGLVGCGLGNGGLVGCGLGSGGLVGCGLAGSGLGSCGLAGGRLAGGRLAGGGGLGGGGLGGGGLGGGGLGGGGLGGGGLGGGRLGGGGLGGGGLGGGALGGAPGGNESGGGPTDAAVGGGASSAGLGVSEAGATGGDPPSTVFCRSMQNLPMQPCAAPCTCSPPPVMKRKVTTGSGCAQLAYELSAGATAHTMSTSKGTARPLPLSHSAGTTTLAAPAPSATPQPVAVCWTMHWFAPSTQGAREVENTPSQVSQEATVSATLLAQQVMFESGSAKEKVTVRSLKADDSPYAAPAVAAPRHIVPGPHCCLPSGAQSVVSHTERGASGLGEGGSGGGESFGVQTRSVELVH
jgi:hypothetical protein